MKLTYVECVIASGQSLSGEIDLRDRDVVGIQMPPAWDAAGLAFQCAGVAYDNARPSINGPEIFNNVVDETGTAIALTVAAATFVALSQAKIYGLRSLSRVKVRSGTNAAPVNQTANRLLTFICLSYD